MSPSALTELLAARIKDLDINQTEFAERVGAQQATVSRWLSGRVIPGDASVPLIAAALKVDEPEVWAARSAAQEERLKRSERVGKQTRRDLDSALARVGEFVQTYEAFHAAYRQMGEQIDMLVGKIEKLSRDVAEIKRDVRSPRPKGSR